MRLGDDVPVVAGSRLAGVKVLRLHDDHVAKTRVLGERVAAQNDLPERPLVRHDIVDDLLPVRREGSDDTAVGRTDVSALLQVGCQVEQGDRRHRGTARVDMQLPVAAAHRTQPGQRKPGFVEPEYSLASQRRGLSGQHLPGVEAIDLTIGRQGRPEQAGKRRQDVDCRERLVNYRAGAERAGPAHERRHAHPALELILLAARIRHGGPAIDAVFQPRPVV